MADRIWCGEGGRPGIVLLCGVQRSDVCIAVAVSSGITKFAYDGNGNKTFKEYPNYETAYYFYDECDRIIKMDEYNVGRKKLYKTTYSWDAEGNRLSEMQYNHGQSGSGNGNSNSGNNGNGNGNSGNNGNGNGNSGNNGNGNSGNNGNGNDNIVNPGGHMPPGLNRGEKGEKSNNPNKPEKPDNPGTEDSADKNANNSQTCFLVCAFWIGMDILCFICMERSLRKNQ